ncbi:MAG: ATP-binding protein [Clostridium sp.]|uniref:HAMP domain-containing sensor histidine kinase n=1 Tax=Clostridium sp. TaxID=1506 RepID=UPI003D6D508A
MNNYLKNRLRNLILFLISGIIILSFVIINVNYNSDFDNKINYCRVLTSELMNNVEKAYTMDNIKSLTINKYEYSLISLEGKIIKTTEKGMTQGDTQNLRGNLAFDNWYEENNRKKIRYSTPLIINNKIVAIVRVIVPKSEVLNIAERKDHRYIIWAVIISLIIIFCSIYKMYKFITIDILSPISKMHKSSKSVLKGDFSEKVSYDYQGEIGEFSHDFEAMRDNLRKAKDLEEKLKKSEKELIACISHDLKTPIASISGYCEGIIDGVVKEERDIKRYSNIILKKARVLTKLIDDILEFSKAEINQMTINKEEIYWTDFFTEVLEELSMDVESTGRKLQLEKGLPNVIASIDKKRIEQVMYNLVTNSIKYTKCDGVITISVKRALGYLVISVKDNGVGIGESELPYVFNKFYRGEKHRNLDIPGSGLGLSIAKYIVEKHGGNIEIESSSQHGTEVTFSILI